MFNQNCYKFFNAKNTNDLVNILNLNIAHQAKLNNPTEVGTEIIVCIKYILNERNIK